MPPDINSQINPLERGLITSLKRRYKINLVKNILLECEHSTPLDFFHTYSIKDVIYSISKLWWDLDSNLIKSAWQKLKLNLNSESVIETVNTEELMSNFAKIGISVSEVKCNEWLTDDSNDPGYGFITDEEIIQTLAKAEASFGEDTLDESVKVDLDQTEGAAESTASNTKKKRIITASRALEYSNELMKWLETQEGARSEDILFMQRIKEIAAGRCYQNLNTSGNAGVPIVTVPASEAAFALSLPITTVEKPTEVLTTALMEVDCNGQDVVKTLTML